MATIRKRGTKWQVQIRRKGHPQIIKAFILKEEAVRWARQRELEMDRGEVEVVNANQHHTLSVILGRYEAEVTVHKRSHLSEAAHLKQIGRHQIAQLPAISIKAEDIAKFRDDRLKTVSNPTVRKELTLLGSIFKVAMQEWGYRRADNPVSSVRKPPSGRSRDRRLDAEGFAMLQQGISTCRNPLMAEAIQFAKETGMRRGEILALEWSNVNLTASLVFLPITKNGSSRTVPLSPAARQVLERLKSMRSGASTNPINTNLVFPISANALRMGWQRLLKRSGLNDFRFHDLRHEAISSFFELGLTVPEVALISGHKDARMLFHYTHLRATDVVAKLSK